MEMLGGELKVESTVGKGSVFWFELELQRVKRSTVVKLPTKQIVGYKGKRRTVLIADDREESLYILLNMLAPLDFEIIQAKDGKSCVKKAVEFIPDLILLDLMMPGINGFEVARQIRAKEELKDMVIIAVSASVSKEMKEKSLKVGCDDFIGKPFELESLLILFQRYLNLEWIYDEEPAKISEIDTKFDVDELLMQIPQKELEALLDYAKQGNLKKFISQLDRIRKLNKNVVPLLNRLQRLVDNFNFNEIIKILERNEKNNGT